MERGLEREAYKAIQTEVERKQVIDSAKSEKVFSKRYEQWEKAAVAMEKQLEVYEMYSWLVGELREGFFFVSAETGRVRSVEEMETLLQVVATLMREVPHLKVQAVALRLERQNGELVKYLEPLKEKVAELQTQVGNPELVRLCILEMSCCPHSRLCGQQKYGDWKRRPHR